MVSDQRCASNTHNTTVPWLDHELLSSSSTSVIQRQAPSVIGEMVADMVGALFPWQPAKLECQGLAGDYYLTCCAIITPDTDVVKSV